MDNSIFRQYQLTKQLKERLVVFENNFRYHVIVGPRYELEDAIRNGIPEDVYNTYVYKYLQRDEMDAYGIIADIRFCITYLEEVETALYNACKES